MKSMNEEKQTCEPQEKGQKYSFVWSPNGSKRGWLSRASVSDQSILILLNEFLVLKLILLHINQLQLIIMKKLSFLLPQTVVIIIPPHTKEQIQITYYSDCVFNPYIHKFSQQQFQIDQQYRLSINFNFLIEAIKTTPKILDNIGVLKIQKIERFGILVTKQKEGIFVSLID